MTLHLSNPHAVLAALARRPHDVREVRLPRQGAGEAWQRVAASAARHDVPVVAAAPRERGPTGGRSGSAEAVVADDAGLDVDELLARDADTDAPSAPWLALDCIQDPRNVGAVFRAAAFFGAPGAFVTTSRSAPLSSVAYDTASGGLDVVPFALVTNLERALRAAKDAGLWILGAAEDGHLDVTEVPLDRRWMLVLGNEEKGLRRLTRERCDETCRITPRASIESLNVSAAAAVLLSHLSSVPAARANAD